MKIRSRNRRGLLTRIEGLEDSLESMSPAPDLSELHRRGIIEYLQSLRAFHGIEPQSAVGVRQIEVIDGLLERIQGIDPKAADSKTTQKIFDSCVTVYIEALRENGRRPDRVEPTCSDPKSALSNTTSEHSDVQVCRDREVP
jgi:hypothetical protein